MTKTMVRRYRLLRREPSIPENLFLSAQISVQANRKNDNSLVCKSRLLPSGFKGKSNLEQQFANLKDKTLNS